MKKFVKWYKHYGKENSKKEGQRRFLLVGQPQKQENVLTDKWPSNSSSLFYLILRAYVYSHIHLMALLLIIGWVPTVIGWLF